MKLSDTHLILLSNAARRDDGTVELPPDIEAVAAQKLVSKLAGAGLIEEIPSHGSLPVWRRLDDVSFSLRITEAGLKAIGIDGTAATTDRAEKALPKTSAKAKIDLAIKPRRAAKAAAPPKAPKPKARKKPKKSPARVSENGSGTKLDRVKTLLARKRGATIQDMMGVADWLPHTIRAVLTGLRKRGFGIEREAVKDKPTIYRIMHKPDSAKSRTAKGRKG